MTNFCGWIGPGALQNPTQRLYALSQQMHSTHATQSFYTENAALAFTQHPLVQHYESDRGFVLVVGHLKGPHQQAQHPWEALLQSLQQQGTQVLSHCTGQFLVLAYLSTGNSLILATDKWASHPVYYARHEGFLVFSTRIQVLKRFPGFTTSLNHDWILTSALGNPCQEHTCYEQCFTVQPSHTLMYREGQLSTQPYWHLPTARPLRSGTLQQRSTQLRKEVRQSYEGQVARYPTSALYWEHHAEAEAFEGLYEGCDSTLMPLKVGVHFLATPESKLPEPQAGHLLYPLTAEEFCTELPALVKNSEVPLVSLSAVNGYFAAQLAYEKGRDHLLMPIGARMLIGDPHTPAMKTKESWLGQMQQRLQRHLGLQKSPSQALRPSTALQLELLGVRRVFGDAFLNRVNTTVWSQDRTHKPVTSFNPSMLQATQQCVGLAGLSVSFPWYEDDLATFCLHLSENWISGQYLFRQSFAPVLSCPFAAPFPKQAPLMTWLSNTPSFKEYVVSRLHQLSHYSWFQPAFLKAMYAPTHPWPDPLRNEWLWFCLNLSEWLESGKV